jgi:hypothetical protein
MRWVDFEAAAPDLGAAARSVVERAGFVYVGTVRRDGAPRISPVEAHFVRGQLMLVMIAKSRKAQDLGRDLAPTAHDSGEALDASAATCPS